MSLKRMYTGKRILAGILAAIMVVSSPHFTLGTVHAEEPTAAVKEEESENQTSQSEDDVPPESEEISSNEDHSESEDSAEKEGTDTESPSREENPAEGEEPSKEEESADDEIVEAPVGEDASDAQEPSDGENSATDEDGENEEKQEEEIEESGTEEVSVTGISDNALAESEPQETVTEAELEGVYQFGGAPSGESAVSVYSASAQDDDAVEYLYQEMLARNTKIDVSAYGIPDDASGGEIVKDLVSGVLNEHPDLYFVERKYSYWRNGTIITAIAFTYSDAYDDELFRQNTAAALSRVDSQMSDLEKAVVLHDYLTVNCEYDYENYLNNSIPDASFSAYGTLANRIAVCQGYALTYKYLLNQVGIDCYMVTSDSMNHAWNMIVLDGQCYQVDVTWDDPTRDRIGRSVHTYMFRSDAAFAGHHDWRVTSGSSVVDYVATDTRYDNAFWTSCTSPLVLEGDDCYYVSSEGSIYKTTLSGITNKGTEVVGIGTWPVWGESGTWVGSYSGLFRIGDRLYYNDKSSIYSIALDGTGKKTEFTADTSTGYIYGSAYCQGKVLYSLHQTPNLTAKEEVLTADIDAGSGETDESKALDLANLPCEYTALDDTTITSAAEGRPKLLIFYSNTCYNCRSTIGSISADIADFAGVDIYALETNGGTKEEVTAFQSQYGCEEITFSYEQNGENSRSMFQYARAGGIDGGVSWPLIVYIDANNRLQYMTMSITTAETVLSNLQKFCGFTVEIPQVYTITYVLDGGTNNDANPTTYSAKDTVITLLDPVRTGYQFEGWYADAAYTDRVTMIYGADKRDLVLYAKWKSLSESEKPTVELPLTEGNVIIGFSGAYYTETAETILNRLNEIRLEACREGVLNPETGNPLTVADYVPLQWSSDLEAIARQRAAEATVNQDHTRPNGQRCFTAVTNNGEQSWAENLAWNYSGMMAGIEQWYGEKSDWVNQTAGKVTGHYTSIISPLYRAVGVGAFRLESGGWYAVAQEFSHKDSLDTQKDTTEGSCVQFMEVQGSRVAKVELLEEENIFMQEGVSRLLSADVTACYPDYYGNDKDFIGQYWIGGSWHSSDETVAVVDELGTVTARGTGTAQINLSAGEQTDSVQITVYGKDENLITVKQPDITTYKVGQEINLKGGTVTYMADGQMKTTELKADMISGFDSSVSGLCTVQVTYEGYTANFDTLIVEEPELSASAGQSLREVALPQNAYGTYTWQDDTVVLEKVGSYTFDAVFTPKDEIKFQKLTDIQVRVTVQLMLGTDTDVTFKADEFIYNGAAQEPKVVVWASGTLLTEGQDYTMSYANNRNAGIATATIYGTGGYLGSVSRDFEIKPAPLTITARNMGIRIGDPVPAVYEYEVNGLVAGDELRTEPSFSCAIADTATAGQYDIIPYGADAGENYKISYINGKLRVASEYITCVVSFAMQGHGEAPADMTDIKVGSTIGKPADPVQAGYRFDGWYRDAACTKAWNFDADIVQSDMTLYAKWLAVSAEGGFALQEISDVHYTGKACKPVVSVYDGDRLLKQGRDYQIKYYNNIDTNKDGVQKQGDGKDANFNAALPYVEIIGKGNYTDRIKNDNRDTVKVNFNILKASIGDGSSQAGDGIKLKVSDQLVTSKKAQKPFSSIKYIKGMKRDVDFMVCLTVNNARDQEGRSLQKDSELQDAVIPAGYSGAFSLTVEGMGNYGGSICREIYVTDKAHLIKNATITIGKNQKNMAYTGSPVQLNPSETATADTFIVKLGKTILKPDRDYTVDYRNNDKVGKAELIITGMGEYAGSKSAYFNMKGKAFTAKTVLAEGIENRVYTGRAITQNDVVLTYGTENESLRYGTDYTINYSRNINKGTATMTFRGMADAGYSGSFKKTFKITAADITQTERSETMQNMVCNYSKAGAKPVEEITLTNGEGITLRNGKDYTLKYANNRAVATASDEKPPTVIVKGKGNYTGEFSLYFTIVRTDLRADSIGIRTSPVAYRENKAPDYAYQPAVKLMDGRSALRAGKDYEIAYRNQTQADYEAYIQKLENRLQAGDGTLQDGEVTAEDGVPVAVITEAAGSAYKLEQPIVVPLPIYLHQLTKTALAVDVDEAVYSGSQVTPQVKVSYGGTPLKEGEDYTLSYGANVASGKNKGSVVISGISPYYGGSVTVKFDIVKKPITY